MRTLKFRAWAKKKKLMINDLNGWSKGYQERYELMQYTGLKDSKGKEIYEGDVSYKKGYGKRGLIRWNSEYAKFEVYFGKGTGGGDITEHIFGDTLKVIGNIYENPELLKGGAE